MKYKKKHSTIAGIAAITVAVGTVFNFWQASGAMQATQVLPASGDIAGGTSVTITGSDFPTGGAETKSLPDSMNRKTSQIHNGKLYMPELVGDKLEIYDIAADTTITKTLPNSMHRETSQVYNDKLYMPERSGNKLEIYDIATDTTATKTLPNSMGRVASQISGGKLYMPGEYNNELEIYDMATDTTETRILLNSTWWRFTSQIYNGKLYMAGNGGMLEIRDLRELNITFNGIPATNVTIVNSTTIIATTPAHTAGTVDVVVSTGAETVTLSSAYTYIDPTSPPVVPGVPNTGLR